MTNNECRQRLNRPLRYPVHDYSTICGFSGRYGTGSGDSGKPTSGVDISNSFHFKFKCFFLSGGPLALHGKILGMSWIFTCALGVPDGFTRVSVHVPWIEQEIRLSGTQSLLWNIISEYSWILSLALQTGSNVIVDCGNNGNKLKLRNNRIFVYVFCISTYYRARGMELADILLRLDKSIAHLILERRTTSNQFFLFNFI